MPPPVETWPASELPSRVLSNTKDGRRKGFNGDLKTCEKLGMLQYRCEVDDPDRRNSTVRCWPVERFFRRCRDKEGTFLVETTEWDEKKK